MLNFVLDSVMEVISFFFFNAFPPLCGKNLELSQKLLSIVFFKKHLELILLKVYHSTKLKLILLQIYVGSRQGEFFKFIHTKSGNDQ